MSSLIGQSPKRQEARLKVTGQAKYTADLPTQGVLTARLLVSPLAHANIAHLDITAASAMPGVKAVVTGEDFPVLCGPLLQDHPPLAWDRVRYAGEPVAMVVALDEATAAAAVELINVEYEPLPAIFDPLDALSSEAPLLHPELGLYKQTVKDVYPQVNSNIASRYQTRKGNYETGRCLSRYSITQEFHLPPSDHLAMEVRCAQAEIAADGRVTITTSSQAPFEVKKQLAEAFGIPSGMLQVKTPFVGGGFGGKAPVFLEFLAYMASSKAGGKAVRVILTREQDLASAPSRLGLRASITLNANQNGSIQAANLRFWLDCGAYADISPYMCKAIAANCSGPYRVDNLVCEVYCVYTNRTPATSFRGFAHASLTFCIERTMDALAAQCGLDPWTFRKLNAISPGDTTPTRVVSTPSNSGDLSACLHHLPEILDLNALEPIRISDHLVRALGLACFWKSATPPPDAVSGALITFNPDGSLNLNTGVVEMGNGSQSHLAQMLAARLGIEIEQVHAVLEVDTRLNPEHYKTVASFTSYLAGRAVIRAAEDILEQLRRLGSLALDCAPEDIVVAQGRVQMRGNPALFIELKELVAGYRSADGRSLGTPLLARGGAMLKGISIPDPSTGQGRLAPAWTVGVSAVEVEVDTREYTYRLLKAATVMDVGRSINPEGMREMIRGGMSMGLSLARHEAFRYDTSGRLSTPNLRSYKLMHIGEEPLYSVDMIETPQEDAPFGTRSMSEHGILGMPAALGNALSAALGLPLNSLPLTPEQLFRAVKEKSPLPKPWSLATLKSC